MSEEIGFQIYSKVVLSDAELKDIVSLKPYNNKEDLEILKEKTVLFFRDSEHAEGLILYDDKMPVECFYSLVYFVNDVFMVSILCSSRIVLKFDSIKVEYDNSKELFSEGKQK